MARVLLSVLYTTLVIINCYGLDAEGVNGASKVVTDKDQTVPVLASLEVMTTPIF